MFAGGSSCPSSPHTQHKHIFVCGSFFNSSKFSGFYKGERRNVGAGLAALKIARGSSNKELFDENDSKFFMFLTVTDLDRGKRISSLTRGLKIGSSASCCSIVIARDDNFLFLKKDLTL